MRRSRNERLLQSAPRSIRPVVLVSLLLASLFSSSQSALASLQENIADTAPANDVEYIGTANAETTYTLDEVANRNTQASCWTVVNEKVYNITSYIQNHPGGADAISKICGKDGTSIFLNQHGGSGVQALILSTYKIGVLYKPPATSCDAGYFVSPSLGTCTPAPIGYFVTSAASAAGTSAATPCPVGKFTSVTGSTECISAALGYFVDTQASTVAKQCQIGFFSSVSGSALCQIAPKGFYVSETASSMATACASGFTTASTGSTASSSCYKPNVQTITAFKAPKALKFKATALLNVITNTKAQVTYKASGACTAKIATITTKVKAKKVTTKQLKLTAAEKAGKCSVTLSSPAVGKYLALSQTVKIKVSKTGK